MKKKKKSAFKTVLGFEYISVIKNKTFIISTILIVAILLIASFIPALIMGSNSSSTDIEKIINKPKIAVVNKAYEKDDIIAKAIADKFNGYDVECIKNESDAQTGVKDGKYSFSIILNKPLEYNYITLTKSVYDTTTDTLDAAVTSAYRITELEKKGINAEESEKILSASAKRNIVTLGTDQATAYTSTYILVSAIYIAIIAYGQLVANSVVTEKSSRAMEMLITCASPSDLMFGKVIGTGFAAFTQIAVILGVGAISLPTMLNSVPAEFKNILSFPIDSVLFALLFFVLAFFIYAFVFAAIASLVSRIEDLSSIMSPIMFIIIFVFMAVIIGMNSGDLSSPLMIVTSYIPFTAPIAMFARIAMSDVAAWEIILSVAIQIASVFIIGKLASAIYRVGVLLYGKPPKLIEALKMVFSKQSFN